MSSAKLVLFLSLSVVFFSSCISSTAPTYKKDDLETTIPKIALQEFNMTVKSKLVGQSFWIYIPIEDLFIKADKPESYKERFEIAENDEKYYDGNFTVDYSIKSIAEKDKKQEYVLNKDVIKKLSDVWSVLRRVIFSMDRKERAEVQFYYLIAADIKNGFELKELTYYLDIVKVMYRYMSNEEYHQRVVVDTAISYKIIDDKEGEHLKFKDITMAEFISAQIKSRIAKKFQGSSAEKNADVDKEVQKIVNHVFNIYDYKDFNVMELNNMLTNTTITLNQTEIFKSK